MKLTYILLAIFVVFTNASGLLGRQIDLTYECSPTSGNVVGGTCKIDGITASCDGKTSLFRGSFDGSIEITNSELDLSGCSRADEGEALVQGSGTTLDVTRNFWSSKYGEVITDKVTACAIRAKVLANPTASAFGTSVIGQNGFSPYCQDRECTGVSADECAGSAHVGDSLLPGDGFGGGFKFERRVDELVEHPSHVFDSTRGHVLTVTLADHDSRALSPAFQAVRLSGSSICGAGFDAFEDGLKRGTKGLSNLQGLFDTSFSAQSHSSIESAFKRDAFALSTSTATADATIEASAVAAGRKWTFASSAWKILNSGVLDSPAQLVNGNMIKSQDIVLDIVHIHPILGPLNTAGMATDTTRAFATCQTRTFVVTTDLDANVVVTGSSAEYLTSRLVVEGFQWTEYKTSSKIFKVQAHVDIYDVYFQNTKLDHNFTIERLDETCANVEVSAISHSSNGAAPNTYTRNTFEITFSSTYNAGSRKIVDVFGPCALELTASKIDFSGGILYAQGSTSSPERPVYSIDVSQVNIQSEDGALSTIHGNTSNAKALTCYEVDGDGTVDSTNLCPDEGGAMQRQLPIGHKIRVAYSASVDTKMFFASNFSDYGSSLSLGGAGCTGGLSSWGGSTFDIAPTNTGTVSFDWTWAFTPCAHSRRRLLAIPASTSTETVGFYFCDPSRTAAEPGGCDTDITKDLRGSGGARSTYTAVKINRKINIAPVLNSLKYANGEITFSTNVNNILHNEGNEHQLQIFEFGRKTSANAGVPETLDCSSKHVTEITGSNNLIINDSNDACYLGLPDYLSDFTLADLYTNVSSWKAPTSFGGQMTDDDLQSRGGSPYISYVAPLGSLTASVDVTAQRNQIDNADGCNVGCVRSVAAGIPSTSCKFDFIVRTLTPDGYPLENYPRLAQTCHKFKYELRQSDRVNAQTAFQSSRGEAVGVQDIEWKLDNSSDLWDLHVTLVYEHSSVVGSTYPERALDVVGTPKVVPSGDSESIKAANGTGVEFIVVRSEQKNHTLNGVEYYYTELELKRKLQYNYTGGSQCDWDHTNLGTNAFSIDISPSKCKDNVCSGAQFNPSDASQRLYRSVLVNIEHFNSCPDFSDATGTVDAAFNQSTFELDAHDSATQSSAGAQNTFSENDAIFIRIEINNTVNSLALHPDELLQFDSVIATSTDGGTADEVTFWNASGATSSGGAADCRSSQCSSSASTCLGGFPWNNTDDWIAENIIRFPAAKLQHRGTWNIVFKMSVHSCPTNLRRRLLSASSSGTLDASGQFSASITIHIVDLASDHHNQTFAHTSQISTGTFNSNDGINIPYQVTLYPQANSQNGVTALTLKDGASCSDGDTSFGNDACSVVINGPTGVGLTTDFSAIDFNTVYDPFPTTTFGWLSSGLVSSSFSVLDLGGCLTKTGTSDANFDYSTTLLLDTVFPKGDEDGGTFHVCSAMQLTSASQSAEGSTWKLGTQTFVTQDRYFSAVLDGLPSYHGDVGASQLKFNLTLKISDSDTNNDGLEKRRRLVNFAKVHSTSNYTVNPVLVSKGNAFGLTAHNPDEKYSEYRLEFTSAAKNFSSLTTGCSLGADSDFSFTFLPLSCLVAGGSYCRDPNGAQPDNTTSAVGYESLAFNDVGVTVDLTYDYTICPIAASSKSITIDDVAAQSFEIVASAGDIKATAAATSASESKFFAGDTVYADFRIDSNDTSDNIGLEFQEVTLCHYTIPNNNGNCSETDGSVDKRYHLVVGRNVAGEYATALKAQTCWEKQRVNVTVSETATYETGACQSTCSFGSLNSTASTAFDVLTFKTDTSMMAASGSNWTLVASANRVRCDYSRNSGGRRLLSVPEKVHFRKLLSIPVGSATVAVSDSVGFQILPASGASLSYPNKVTAKLSSTSETTTDASKSNTLVYVLVVVALVALVAVILGAGMRKNTDIGVGVGVNPTGGTKFRVRRNTRMRRSRVVYNPVLSHE